MELKSRNMIQIEGVPPSVPAEPFRDVETIKAHRVPASIMHDPALIDSDEENWLDESDGNLLVVSPYRSRDHLLDLRALNTDQWLLAQALTALHNIRPDYATCPYAEAFNWSEVANNLRYLVRTAKYVWTDQHFYIVVFRSQITPTTNRSHLSDLDRISHVEAMKSGGLLKYWFGVTDEAGRNVATCVWRKQADARPGSVGAGHKAAMRATMSMYTEWKVERLKLVITADEKGEVRDWSISEWVETDG